ncbi:histidine kinase [Desulfosporosinus sp. SB140]|uniref:sensor histidine kinase n=1 Tax=Desulfosporosinus paludis TaxID=3115649 RepID=UPI00388D6B08
MKNTGLTWRIVLILSWIALIFFGAIRVFSSSSDLVDHGRADLSSFDFKQSNNKSVVLKGDWEFYWNRLLTPDDFINEPTPPMDSFLKVPGSWDEQTAGTKGYPHHGFATYRLHLIYPTTLKDPALSIRNVANAYRLYVNGRFIAEVGKVSDRLSDFKNGEKSLILELPKDTQELELIFQVANLDYTKGGLHEAPVFGSKQVIERQEMILSALQLLFIGGVFIFSLYYFLLFILQTRNKTALFFSLLCFITALRSSIWGLEPIGILFPNVSFDGVAYINYLTGYNLLPLMILFVHSLYPFGSKVKYTYATRSVYYLTWCKKLILALVLLPTLFFDGLLLFKTPQFMSSITNYLYLLVLLQMIYVMSVLIIAVLQKRDNARLMFIAFGIFVMTILADILHYLGIGGINISYMFLYGNFAVILAMSFVQSQQQALTHKKLILYNQKLVEADKLKDKIMATEMSFLQAQIKPHFLYNALSAIANICENDGTKASKLIIDLAIYLRGSLEFNHLDKRVTIEKELEFIETYFNIEQARFGQKIQLLKELSISSNVQIPVLILQPLVENAVRHGISKKQEGGRVTVRLMTYEKGIRIEIEDDGIGMEEERLIPLLSERRNGQGVGLLNIHHRLLRLYGRGLDISSEVGRGTCVRLVIPEGRKPL